MRGDLSEEVAFCRDGAEKLVFDALQVIFHDRENGQWGRRHRHTLCEIPLLSPYEIDGRNSHRHHMCRWALQEFTGFDRFRPIHTGTLSATTQNWEG